MSTTWPASLWQRFALTLDLDRPGMATGPWFTMNAVLRVEGDFDPGVLVAAARDLVARHDVLRSRLDPEAVAQVVEDVVRPDVEVSAEAPSDPAEWLHRPVPSTARTPLVLRVARRSPREHVLSAHLHHLMADPATLWQVLHDLGALYSARCGAAEPDPPTAQYGEYAAVEADLVRAQHVEAARWWRGALDGVRFASPPLVRSAPFAVRRPVLDARRTAELEARARAARGSPFAALLAVLAGGMARHTASGDHVLFSTLFLRRDHPRWRTLAGPCITPSYAVVPLDAASDVRAVTRHLGAAQRFSRHPVWQLARVIDALADPGTSVPFVELIPQLRPDAIPFGPARAVVAHAAGPRDTGDAGDLGIRFRKEVDGSLAAHVSGNGVGWTEPAAHAVLDGLPHRVGALGRAPSLR